MLDDARLRALELAEGLDATASAIDRITKATTPEAARWAFSQWDLRRRARAKFALADTMLFDREGLEMASHEDVARYHGSLFPKGARVVEIGTGVGADTIALLERGPVDAFEVDRDRAAMARHNAQMHDLEATIQEEDGIGSAASPYVFADPARRNSNQRRLDLSRCIPSPEEVVRRFVSGSNPQLLVLKLSPLFDDRDLEALVEDHPYRLEFLSFGRECREALLMVGQFTEVGRYAVHAETRENLRACPPPDSVAEAMEFIFEADPAAIRAHSLGAFGVPVLGDSQGYLTSNEAIMSPFLRAYRVAYCGPGDLAKTRRALTELSATVVAVKQRHAGIDPRQIEKSLPSRGPRHVVLMVWLNGKSVRHALVEGH